MNKKQKVILSLLQEIDEICRRNKIEYYLSPRLTLCAVEGHPFPQNPMFGVVLMKTADMERIPVWLWMKIQGKREHMESMKSHKVLRILSEIHQYRYSVPESGQHQRLRISGNRSQYFSTQNAGSFCKSRTQIIQR